MLKLLKYILGAMGVLGYVGNSLLILYIWWLEVSKSFIDFINPFAFLGAILTALTNPLFWVLLVITIIGQFGAGYVENIENAKNKSILMERIIKNRLAIAIVFFLLGAIVMNYVNPKSIVTPPTAINNNDWNTKLVDKFSDEPKLDNYKISSASSWIIPSNPSVITTDPRLKFLVDRLFIDENSLKESDWNKHPDFKEMLDKQNLDKKYHNYFIKSGNAPVPNLTEDTDVNGDGNADKIFQSIGLGCASCHVKYIDIFIGGKRYEAGTNEGGIYPRVDHKGFYITNAFIGSDYATCCPDNIAISKYEWNGDGFTEIARKTIWISKK